LFFGTTELVIQIRKSNSPAVFFGDQTPGTTPKKTVHPSSFREPPLLRPTPPKISVRGKELYEVGCTTEFYTDGLLTEKIYTLKNRCDVCKKHPSVSKEKPVHLQRKFFFNLTDTYYLFRVLHFVHCWASQGR
jgi:hypothetical protein